MNLKTPFEQGRLAGQFDEALDQASGRKPDPQKETARPSIDPAVERMLKEKGIKPDTP